MTLQTFLEDNRVDILALSDQKTAHLAGSLGTSPELKAGLPIFYNQLIKILKEKLKTNSSEELLSAAATHGKEFLRLGYSLSHVVHAYGAMCQAITEIASKKRASISPGDFNILNGCLDVAIATAVSEFQFRSSEASEQREIEHLGFLAHELRNALSSATVAHEMIKAGLVGTGGSTARLLETNFVRMRNLIDRSLSEVRMRANADLVIEKFRLSDLIDQIVTTARSEAFKKNQTFVTEVDWHIEIEADRQFVMSAIANLVQNAIKYTQPNGTIWLRGKSVEERIVIEVEDECGGLEPDKIESLFEPYVQAHSNRSGLGLGLAIVKRSIALSQGTVSVRNKPGTGCAFIINLPQKFIPVPSNKAVVRGIDSVQPDFK